MTVQTFPLIEVSGCAYELGYQHGAQAAHLIQRYLLWIEKLTGLSRELLGRWAMAFFPLLENLSPALVKEIRGLAAGAAISFEEALLCQLRSEAADLNQGGCTAFALTGRATVDQQPLAGQNQDLAPEFAEVAILLRVKPSDGRPRALMFTFAGQIGYAGMNEYGLTHFNNTLYDYLWQPGYPRQPLKRVMLEKRTVTECANLLAHYRTCSAANLILCDRQGYSAAVEIRPEGIACPPANPPGCHLHTNHYLASEFTPYDTHPMPDSYPRLERLRSLVAQHWGRLTVEILQAILADHTADPGGICRHGALGLHTIAGYIAEPAKGRLHVRRGHGCLGTWQTYEI